jgi:hypothetical protein
MSPLITDTYIRRSDEYRGSYTSALTPHIFIGDVGWVKVKPNDPYIHRCLAQTNEYIGIDK